MTDAQAETIISLLGDILSALKSPAQDYEDQQPWAIKIVHEHTTGEDRDNNDLTYGEDFIFNQTIESHPAMLQNLAAELNKTWTGKRLSFPEYYQTLPAGPTKDKLMAYMKKLDAKRS